MEMTGNTSEAGCGLPARIGMEKITIMVGNGEGARIERTIGKLFPMSGLFIECADSGVNVWGESASLEAVRDFLGGKTIPHIEKAIRAYRRAVREAKGNARSYKALTAYAWYDDLVVLAAKREWY